MASILDQPFPLSAKFPRRLFIAACFGAFVALFLFVFKPFQLDQLEREDSGRFIFCVIMYGLMVFSCIVLMVIVLPLIFPNHFVEEKWTVRKEIIFTTFTMFFIGLANFFLSHFLVGSPLNLRNILWFQFVTTSIGITPIVIFVLIRQNQQLKKYSAEAASLQSKLAEMNKIEMTSSASIAKVDDNERLVIKGDYQKEKVDIRVNELLYVAAANNYVKVYYFDNHKVVYSILRITMKKMEDTLLPYPNFFRCHRAYMINLYRVKEVIGNAQGYKIKLEDVEELIPVSRNLNAEFSDKVLSKRD